MPSKPKKINRAYAPERKPFQREVDNSAFYNSWPWRKKRKQHLLKEPLCRMCKSNDIITAANMVDHIVPIAQGGAPLEDSNLQSLCDYRGLSCHEKKSATESRGK